MTSPLTPDQIDHFLERGHVVLPGALDPDLITSWVSDAWGRLGVDPDDPSGWSEKRIHLPTERLADVAAVAPAVWEAAAALVGGADRVVTPWRLGDGFIANLGVGDDRPWEPPSPAVRGWHKDGDFFRHFLDSPEQGLLTIVLWTDMHHRGGGTFVAADSVGVVARHLAEHPEGVLPDEFDTAALIAQCQEFVELTGSAGDVVLLHPYVLHATSQNVIGHARLITNPPIALREPMRFDRDDPADHSPVEQAVLRGLGVDAYPFAPAVPRESVVPARIRRQQEREAARRAS